MNVLQEQDIIEFIEDEGFLLNEMYDGFCRECEVKGKPKPNLEEFEENLQGNGAQILTINNRKYVYGTPPPTGLHGIDEEEGKKWLADHGWLPIMTENQSNKVWNEALDSIVDMLRNRLKGSVTNMIIGMIIEMRKNKH